MTYLEYIDYMRELTHTPNRTGELKTAIQASVESEERRSLSDDQVEGLKLELKRFTAEEKESLICEQVSAINRLARLNAELQAANDQLAAALADKTRQWMAQPE